MLKIEAAGIGSPQQTQARAACSMPPQPELLGLASAVVSQEQFDLAGEKLSKNKSFARRGNKTHEYLLRALVGCGACTLASIVPKRETGPPDLHRYRKPPSCKPSPPSGVAVRPDLAI